MVKPTTHELERLALLYVRAVCAHHGDVSHETIVATSKSILVAALEKELTHPRGLRTDTFWTAEDVAILEQGLKSHMPISVIARALQRSGRIVRLRAKKLGLIE